jgi:HAE1 family hydrophobic/amphiphilic exporter-1
MERGEQPFEAPSTGANEISFTIMSMTISLAAVFIPLVFMTGLVGRIFREFAITIVIAIFASGLVSLTLTPLMCARLLRARGEGTKKNWVERVIGGIERRVLRVYGGSLWWFLRHRWVSALIWVICLGRNHRFVHDCAEAFLPLGDSSVIFGAFIAREGSSPAQMHALQDRVDQALHEDPKCHHRFYLDRRHGIFVREPGHHFHVYPSARTTSANSASGGSNDGQGSIRFQGVFTFLQPFAVLQISTSATPQTQGQYAYAISGVNGPEVYNVGQKLLAKMMQYPGFSPCRPIILRTRRISMLSCAAIRRRHMASQRRAFSRCCGVLIRKTTFTW